MAVTILRSREPPTLTTPGQTWCYRFIARKDDLKVFFSRQLDRARAVTITKPLLDGWFQLFYNTYRAHSI